MNIVILDGYTENPGDLKWDGFKALGDLTVYDRTPEDKIIKRIENAEAVIVNKTPITRKTLEACPKIKYIGVLATGYNVIDIRAAAERNIPVCNVPAYGTDAVAQFAISLLLEICHHIGGHDGAVHAGRWSNCLDWCFWEYPLIELAGKTIGIIGFGRIGQRVGQIAEALGMKVIYYSPHKLRRDPGCTATSVSLNELLHYSDVITLHCPLFPETKGIINKNTIEAMKDGVILINNSRGQLIIEEDLVKALECGKVAAAGVDVVSDEPIHNDNPLLNAPNCIITPHISWAPKESRQRLMNIAVKNLSDFMKGCPRHIVNGL